MADRCDLTDLIVDQCVCPTHRGDPDPAPVEIETVGQSFDANGEAWLSDLVGTPHERRHRFTRWHGGFPVPTVESIRRDLAGRDLACWCPLTDPAGRPVPCHADVLLSLANHPGDLP